MHKGDHLDSVIDFAWRQGEKSEAPAQPAPPSVRPWTRLPAEDIADKVTMFAPALNAFTLTGRELVVQSIQEIIASHFPSPTLTAEERKAVEQLRYLTQNGGPNTEAQFLIGVIDKIAPGRKP